MRLSRVLPSASASLAEEFVSRSALFKRRQVAGGQQQPQRLHARFLVRVMQRNVEQPGVLDCRKWKSCTRFTNSGAPPVGRQRRGQRRL